MKPWLDLLRQNFAVPDQKRSTEMRQSAILFDPIQDFRLASRRDPVLYICTRKVRGLDDTRR